MSKLAFVFPGQGAQYVGMGKILADEFSIAREVFSRADETLGFNLSRIIFEGTQVELDRTETTQPALFATSVAVFEVLKSIGIMPVCAAGLSLGEYSALAASGCISFEDGLRLVVTRGRIMQNAVPEGVGMMAAIMGVEAEKVEAVCQEITGSMVSIANYNCPGQIVVSGYKEGVQKAIETIKAGGGRAVPLAVSVPSHSFLMSEAAELLEEHLKNIIWNDGLFPVISNVSAEEIKRDAIVRLLKEQLYSPVKWQQSIERIAPLVDGFVEVGPGKSLQGLIKKITRPAILTSVETPESIGKLISSLKGESN